MEERKEIDFGKRYRVGNFEVVKITRAMGKRELEVLRNSEGIPKDVRKHLNRSGLPYILVQTLSGGWSISYVCGSSMYRFIEYELCNGDEGMASLVNLFTMMYSDTSVLGDDEYWKDKAEALNRFIERQRAKSVSQEDEKSVLDALKTEEEAKATIVEMAKK